MEQSKNNEEKESREERVKGPEKRRVGLGLENKKNKKWSLSGLFRKRRTKSSDTDCSCSDGDCKRKGGFLSRRRTVRGRQGGSHRVIGKFESVIMPKAEHVNVSDSILDKLEQYDTSPNVMNRRFNNIGNVPTAVTQSNQEMSVAKIEPEFLTSSSGSLDDSKRTEKHKIKARVEALRYRRCDDSSSEEYGSSRNSNCSSVQRVKGQDEKIASAGKKSKAAARTDRYIKRHFKGEDDDAAREDYPGGSKEIFDKTSAEITAKTVTSPLARQKKFLTETSSLPSKSMSSAMTDHFLLVPERRSSSWPDNESVSVGSIRLKEPRNKNSKKPNPHRKRDKGKLSVRNASSPSSSPRTNRPLLGQMTASDQVNDEHWHSEQDVLDKHSSVITCSIQTNSHPCDKRHRNTYAADKQPRSRHPILVTEDKRSMGYVRHPETDQRAPVDNSSVNNIENFDSSYFCNSLFGSHLPHDTLYPLPASASLSSANELGIPQVDGYTSKDFVGRPLSMVLEKSEYDQPTSENSDSRLNKPSIGNVKSKSKSSNLEEALKELEEIYDSLWLSDDELLERADRRDVSEALKRNLSRCRYSWSDLNGQHNEPFYKKRYSSSLDCLYSNDGFPTPPFRIANSRRSIVPDILEDDMAYRKLNKQNQETKSTCNIVSQSGSFLLMSPTLSPPPLFDIPVSPSTSKEPDITLDDVVYRNYRQAINTLKIMDPQPPFGIPVGPISSASENDYLHATPRSRYRSSFKPCKIPDVVTDDLAYRSLRKDVQVNGSDPVQPKLKPVPSLNHRRDKVLSKINYHVRRNPVSNARIKVSDKEQNWFPKDDKVLSNIATEAKTVSKELKQRLRELEAIPSRKKLLHEEGEDIKYTCKSHLTSHRVKEKDLFVGKVVHHKPITLNQFKITDTNLVGNQSNGVNDCFYKKFGNQKNSFHSDDSSSNYVKEVCETATRLRGLDCTPKEYNENSSDLNKENTCRRMEEYNKEISVQDICDSFDWDKLKLVCLQAQPKYDDGDNYVQGKQNGGLSNSCNNNGQNNHGNHNINIHSNVYNGCSSNCYKNYIIDGTNGNSEEHCGNCDCSSYYTANNIGNSAIDNNNNSNENNEDDKELIDINEKKKVHVQRKLNSRYCESSSISKLNQIIHENTPNNATVPQKENTVPNNIEYNSYSKPILYKKTTTNCNTSAAGASLLATSAEAPVNGNWGDNS